MADRKISDLTALTTPATGDLIPIVDISEAAAADKNKSITVGELLRGAPDGTAAAPGIAFESDGGNGMFLGGTDILAFSTGGTQAVTIDASQRLGVGTTPSEALTVSGKVQATTEFKSESGNDLRLNAGSENRDIFMQVNGSTLMTVQGSTGNVGIGTTSPGYNLHIGDGSATALQRIDSSATALLSLRAGTSSECRIEFGDSGDDDIGKIYYDNSTNSMEFSTNASEAMRIDSSGRLLVGTSSALTGSVTQYSQLVQLGNTSGSTGSGILSLGVGHAATSVSSGNNIGRIYFTDSAAGEFASIVCQADGTPGASDYPGRLIFSTTADSASSPTERLAIRQDGIAHFYADTNSQVLRSAAAAGTSNYFIAGVYNASGPQNGGSVSFRVWTNGNVINTNDSYGAISDIKLKENIVDAESQWDDFKAVRFRKYNFKEETGHETFTQLGVIAQELELVSPGLVTETPDLDEEGNDLGTTTKSVKYSVLTKKALVALQEAMERIEQLEAKVAALEAS